MNRQAMGEADAATWGPNDIRQLRVAAFAVGIQGTGGIGRLDVIRGHLNVIESTQLHARPGRQARPREEVLASVGRAIQRTA